MKAARTTEDQLERGTARLFYWVCGEGEPVVLLHGNFNDHHIWNGQISALSASFQVIAYDQRGYGRSSTPQEAFSALGDLVALLDHLQLEQVTLIGSSSGGALALDCALAYPRRVKRLILVGPSVSGRAYPLPMLWKGITNYRRVQSRGKAAAIEAMLQDVYWQYLFPSPAKPSAGTAIEDNVRNPDNFCRIPAKLTTSPKPGAWKQLHTLHLPVQILTGSRDHRYNRTTAALLQKKLPHARTVIMEDCGHLPFAEEPEAFNRLVLEELL